MTMGTCQGTKYLKYRNIFKSVFLFYYNGIFVKYSQVFQKTFFFNSFLSKVVKLDFMIRLK